MKNYQEKQVKNVSSQGEVKIALEKDEKLYGIDEAPETQIGAGQELQVLGQGSSQ
jgi:hypothetical protein